MVLGANSGTVNTVVTVPCATPLQVCDGRVIKNFVPTKWDFFANR